jgi:hypothetical protein
MWGRPCEAEAHAVLADMYSALPDFRARYESIAAGKADFLSLAIKTHSARAPR